MSDHQRFDDVQVLANSMDFFAQLKKDINSAEKSIRIQCMSFEADAVGNALIDALEKKPEVERILLVDEYSRFVVNDTFLNGPGGWLNKNNARTERKQLNKLLNRAKDAGIQIHFTSPMGFLMRRYPMRNHKKTVLIDDSIAYVGGMNFTEHNFEWADFMFRHTNADLVDALTKSFEADQHNLDLEAVAEISEELTVFNLDGSKTRRAHRQLEEMIISSKKVVAVSPYISYPVLDAIAKVPDNTVILPANNNKPIFHFIHGLKRYTKVNFKHVAGEMVHAKLLILDDSIAIYGSSNFDFVSYLFEKEIVLVNKNQRLVSALNTIISGLLSSST